MYEIYLPSESTCAFDTNQGWEKSNTGKSYATPETCAVLWHYRVPWFYIDGCDDSTCKGQANPWSDLERRIDLSIVREVFNRWSGLWNLPFPHREIWHCLEQMPKESMYNSNKQSWHRPRSLYLSGVHASNCDALIVIFQSGLVDLQVYVALLHHTGWDWSNHADKQPNQKDVFGIIPFN